MPQYFNISLYKKHTEIICLQMAQEVLFMFDLKIGEQTHQT